MKNGSEQVIDDARSHITTIKMLRQFHYIDLNAKDQGINVRNRARELGELLSDVDRIRSERKKARATKNKYGGVEGGGNSGFGSSGFGNMSGGFGASAGSGNRSRYGGFGSDSAEYGGYGSGEVYGDGGGFGGSSSRYDDDRSEGFERSRPNHKQKYEEYDEFDEGAPSTSRVSTVTTTVKKNQATNSTTSSTPSTAKAAPSLKTAAMDLLSIDDDSTPANGKNTTSTSSNALDGFDEFATPSSKAAADDDDFDDFQAAPPPSTNTSTGFSTLLPAPPGSGSSGLNTISSLPTTFAAPQPRSSQQAANITGLVGMTTPAIQKSAYAPPPTISTASPLASMNFSSSSSTPAPVVSQPYQPMQPNYFTSIPSRSTTSSVPSPQSTGGVLSPTHAAATTTKSSNDAFGNIWATAVASGIKAPSSATPKSATPVQATSLAEMAKTKAQMGLWGNQGTSSSMAGSGSSGAFGSFGGSGGAGAGQNKTGGDLDDLLG